MKPRRLKERGMEVAVCVRDSEMSECSAASCRGRTAGGVHDAVGWRAARRCGGSDSATGEVERVDGAKGDEG